MSNINFDIWILGDPKNIPCKIAKRFKSNALHGPLTDLSTWEGFCILRPQQGVKYQIWYFDFRGLYISHEKLSKNGKVPSYLGFNSKAFPKPLTDLSTCVEFCTLSPKQGVKYLDLGGTYIYIPWKIAKGISRGFNWLKCMGRIIHLKPTAGCQISTLIFGFGGYKYSMKNCSRTANCFPTWGLNQRYYTGL